MIATNYRKYPQAMALQLVLDFGRVLVWATKRPTTKALRAIRALRGAAFKAAGRIAYPETKTCPSWVKVAQRLARELAELVKEAQRRLPEEAGQDGTDKPSTSARPYRLGRHLTAARPEVYLMDGGWYRVCRHADQWPQWLHGANDFDAGFERND